MKAVAMAASTSPRFAVLEAGPGRRHRSRGMGDVVGDDLVGVDAAAATDGRAGGVDQPLGEVDRLGGAGESAVSGALIGPQTLPAGFSVPLVGINSRWRCPG